MIQGARIKTQKSIFTIGAKFLSLILMTLLAVAGVIVYNATNLFQKDNLNNIYVASDLLTSAKANEVGSWLNSVIQKGSVIGKILVTKTNEMNDDTDPTLQTFSTDSDVIWVQLFEEKDGTTQPTRKWKNDALIEKSQLEPADIESLQSQTTVPEKQVQAGAIMVSNSILDSGQILLSVFIPLVQKEPGTFDKFVGMVVKQDKLLESFSDSGAYQLALVDGQGNLLAHPDADRVKQRENLSYVPIVKKMLESSVSREFQEFTLEQSQFLGAYAKVGIAGMGVISQIPRSQAFEAGQTLIRRSVLIAVLALSISFIIAYFFAQTLVSPIRELGAAAVEIAKGHFDISVEVKTRDEISDLATSFNTMTAEIGRKIQNLSRINESSKVISSTLDVEKLMTFSVDTLKDLLHVEHAVGWQQPPEGEETDLSKAIFHGWDADQLESEVALVEQAEASKQPVISEFRSEEKVLICPIIGKERTIGFIIVGGKEFTDEDIFMAGTIMTSVAITFENIDLLEKTADSARMEKELETAKLVQDTMFPDTEIKIGDLDIYSYYVPASECGGDWWGYIPLDDGKVVLAIGDATGHGVPAAMVTATTKASCSVLHLVAKQAPDTVQSPGKILEYLNKAVYEATYGNILMTFFVAVLDTKTGHMTYASASHDPIYFYKLPEDFADQPKGNKELLDALLPEPGSRLGQKADSTYVDSELQLRDGDVLVLYTDGLPEGKCEGASDEYGERKFMRSIVKHAHKPMGDMRQGLLDDFHKYIGTEPLHDDVTLALCQYRSPHPSQT